MPWVGSIYFFLISGLSHIGTDIGEAVTNLHI
jgi:hypothetical protein